MKFNELYQKTIKYFPASIDISDGIFTAESKGFLSPNLSESWNLAESYAENEWEALLVWVIYQKLHAKAISIFKTDSARLIETDKIGLSGIEKMFSAALQDEGYEDMLKEYQDS
ncbi:hypothetical protein [Dyadobacter sandarakinus]|uniref:Uncharacterized protein n=1 Tax=Dyadobacter sandarakinus TaxID=2747268 RepID=A0ABX7I3X9_9BACT|nr:hypothetical protein [Dyadobacter sandarakinus]QRR00782.1 hypothetical protein HWI92_07605 [Dyadobacter sandarakinus]